MRMTDGREPERGTDDKEEKRWLLRYGATIVVLAGGAVVDGLFLHSGRGGMGRVRCSRPCAQVAPRRVAGVLPLRHGEDSASAYRAHLCDFLAARRPQRRARARLSGGKEARHRLRARRHVRRRHAVLLLLQRAALSRLHHGGHSHRHHHVVSHHLAHHQ